LTLCARRELDLALDDRHLATPAWWQSLTLGHFSAMILVVCQAACGDVSRYLKMARDTDRLPITDLVG
jgi:hypothetical protein